MEKTRKHLNVHRWCRSAMEAQIARLQEERGELADQLDAASVQLAALDRRLQESTAAESTLREDMTATRKQLHEERRWVPSFPLAWQCSYLTYDPLPLASPVA